jgi:cell division protein FtsN
MTDQESNRFGLDDPERLPWLETADGYEYEESGSPLKVAAMVLGGLALLAAIVGGIYWMQRNQSGGQGNGELIAAQEGNYKVAPTDREGKSFEGEGDSAFAASQGQKADAKIDPAKAKAAATAAATPAPLPAATPAGKTAAVPAGAAFVQLGAYSDAAKAEAAWTALGKRFGAISGTNKRVVEGAGEGGRKVFRLQAISANPAAAQQLCAKLKAAGENCLIAK